MNKDKMIIEAIDILKTVGVVKIDETSKEEYIEKTFRAQISSFGASVEMGSLLSAVAFFSSKGGSSTDRPRLMQAIYLLLDRDAKEFDDKSLLKYVIENSSDSSLKKKVIEAAVAVKLAMNAYELKPDKVNGG